MLIPLLLCALLLTAHTCDFLLRPVLQLLELIAYRHREREMPGSFHPRGQPLANVRLLCVCESQASLPKSGQTEV